MSVSLCDAISFSYNAVDDNISTPKMLINKLFGLDDINIMDEADPYEGFREHADLKERLRKTLYFGSTPRMNRPSLPMTELAVEYFHEAVPRQLGQVDMYWASSVSKKASISPCAMMLGMLYIDRLRHKSPDYIEKMSSEELFLISMMLASKYLYDEGVTEEVYNDEWADSADMDVEDINQLEYDFLQAIDWNLYVSEEDFLDTLNRVEEQIAFKQSKHNGFLTYNDFCVLLQNENVVKLKWDLLKDICKVFAICSVAYTTSTVSMAGAVVTLDIIRTELQTVRPLIFDHLPLPLLVKHFGVFQHPADSVHGMNNLGMSHSRILQPKASPVAGHEGTETPNPALEEQPGDAYDVQPKTLYSASRFLTLSLFKDTLMAFVLGMKRDCTNSGIKKDESSPFVHSASVCHCPVCPLKLRGLSRRNKTCHDSVLRGNRPADTNWNHLINKLLHLRECKRQPAVIADSFSSGNLDGESEISCSTEADGLSPFLHTRYNVVMRKGCAYEKRNELISSRYMPSGLHTPPILA